MKTTPDIKFLFEPRSTAVIGASTNTKKIGYKVLENIVKGGFQGKIYPVNPAGGEILGLTIYKTLEEIEEDIDLVSITVPVSLVFDAVKSCANKNVKFISIITSGFAEIGNNELENEIVCFANTHGMRILGPNVFGLFVAKTSLIASFAPRDILQGGVALISQSGALGTAIIGESKVENIGLSAMISIGNKSDIDESDLIEYLVTDSQTKVIFIYTEGIKRGQRLIQVLKMATKIKPIIIIKSGRSKRGAQAAASHTGSLAGADEVFDDIVKECGVHRAESIPEAMDWCKFLSSSPTPQGENTVIITNGGGAGVLATDACEKFGIKLYENENILKQIFEKLVPNFGSTKNPIDITGQVGIEGYEKCIEQAMEHPEIHSIICIGCEHALFNEKSMKETIARIHDKYGKMKPINYTFYGGQGTKNAITHLKAQGVPVFQDVYQAISAMGELYKDFRRQYQRRTDLPHIQLDLKKIQSIIDEAKAQNRNFLLAHECQALMQIIGVPVPQTGVAHNENEAIEKAKLIGFPIVMKVISKDILHKSDAGGVILNIKNVEEVKTSYSEILKNCQRYNPDAIIQGVEIAEMLPQGLEVIIGAKKDPSFGPIVMFGQGGIYVEILKDVNFHSFPISQEEIKDMIENLRISPLLNGVRGQKAKDKKNILTTIAKIGYLIQHCPQITDVELNPVFVYNDKIRAVDSRVLIS